jgi:putative tryptophan/tyrosine transport system substrate-binding protein
MRRRDVLALLAGALAPRSLSAFAEDGERVRVIGVLIGLPENDTDVPIRVATFEQALRELGWTDGRNIRIHYRFADGVDRLQKLAKELVALQPDVLVAASSILVFALLGETRATPIVFVTAADPVGDGFVASLARPGGNLTGFTNNLSSMGGKWLELLMEIAPDIRHVAAVFNPDTAPRSRPFFVPTLEAAAAPIGVKPTALPVRTVEELDHALAALGQEAGAGLIVMPDNFTSRHRDVIVELAARYKVPAIYPFRYFATAGGLISYGADLLDSWRRTPAYVDRILRGVRPSDLPVQTPSKIDLIINLKAAKALGLTVPRIMIARADEVIE